MRLRRTVVPGANLSLVVHISPERAQEVPAACGAVQGVVLRSEPYPDGRYGLAVALVQQ